MITLMRCQIQSLYSEIIYNPQILWSQTDFRKWSNICWRAFSAVLICNFLEHMKAVQKLVQESAVL